MWRVILFTLTLIAMDELVVSSIIIGEVYSLKNKISSQSITIQKHSQTFLAKDLGAWIEGEKLDYPYFTYRSNNPYIRIYSNTGTMLDQDVTFSTRFLPYKNDLNEYYFEGIKEGDTITIYYGKAL